MSQGARIPGATSDEQAYEDGLQAVVFEDGLLPVPEQAGLQVVPLSPHRSSQATTAAADYPPSDQNAYYATAEKKSSENMAIAPVIEPSRIWGLRRKTFWILVIILAIVIIAAAVGAGVGGSLSYKNQASSIVTSPGSGTPISAISSSSSTQTTTPSPSGTSRPGYCAKLVPNWIPQGTIATGIGKDGYGVRFADLNGDGRVEYLYVETNGAVTAFLNLGSPDPNPLNAGKVGWLDQGVIATGVGGLRDQIRFADLDGDGKADYIWVHDDGSADAWLNMGGPDDGADAAKVTWVPQGTIASGLGKDGTNVVFADVDGDGRADYLWLNPSSGDVSAFLNTGPPSNNRTQAGQVGWNPVGIIATGFTVGVGTQTFASGRFADINGDGRMDYSVLSYVNGNVSVWLNQANNKGNFTWKPTGVIAAGVGDDGRTVQFGDLNGDGRWDYLDVNSTSGAVDAWLNGC